MIDKSTNSTLASRDGNNNPGLLGHLPDGTTQQIIVTPAGAITVAPPAGTAPPATEATLTQVRDAILNSKDVSPQIAGKDPSWLYVFYKFTFDQQGNIILPVSIVDHTWAPYTGVLTPIANAVTQVSYSYDICLTATHTTLAVYDISTDSVITSTIYKDKTTNSIVSAPTAGSYISGACATQDALDKMDAIKTSIDAVKTEVIAGYTQAHTDSLAEIAKLDIIKATVGDISVKLDTANTKLTAIDASTASADTKLSTIITSLATQTTNLDDINTAIVTADGNNTAGQTAIISAVDSAKTTITTAITTASATLTSENATTQSKIDTVTTAVNTAKTAIDTVNTSITTATATAHADALAIEATQTTIIARLDTLITNSGSLNTLVGTTNSTLASILADTTALNSKITTTNVKLDTVNGSIVSLKSTVQSEFDQTQLLLNDLFAAQSAQTNQDASLWSNTIREVEQLVCYQSKTITRVTRYNQNGDIIDIRYKGSDFDTVGWFTLTSDQVTEGACLTSSMKDYETTCGGSGGGGTVAIGTTGWGWVKGTGSDFTITPYEVFWQKDGIVYIGNGLGASGRHQMVGWLGISGLQDWVNSLGFSDYFYISFTPSMDVEVFTPTQTSFTPWLGNSLEFPAYFGMGWDSTWTSTVTHTGGGKKALLVEECEHPVDNRIQIVPPSTTFILDRTKWKNPHILFSGVGTALIDIYDLAGVIVQDPYTQNDTYEINGKMVNDLTITTDANITATIYTDAIQP